MVPGTQALGPRRPDASGHRACRATKHRITGIEDENVAAELRAHHGHQLRQQARRARHALPGHKVTSLPVNQPAASSARRASSAVRWP
jgi:hypothetical protein